MHGRFLARPMTAAKSKKKFFRFVPRLVVLSLRSKESPGASLLALGSRPRRKRRESSSGPGPRRRTETKRRKRHWNIGFNILCLKKRVIDIA